MKITNKTSRDMSVLIKTLESFIPYTQERLGYDKPFQVFFESDEENSKNIFGKTAYYDPATMNVHVYVDGRHDKDMLRSISHEIVHHHQNCRGDFDGAFEVGEGYAQKSPHLRNMEAEAYLIGNGLLVRDYEDNIKLGESMIMEWKENKKVIKEEEQSAIAPDETIENLMSSLKILIRKILKKSGPEIEKINKIEDKMNPSNRAKLITTILNLIGIDDQEQASTMGKVKTNLSNLSPAAMEEEKSESIKDHIKNKNQTLSEHLMKKWFEGDK